MCILWPVFDRPPQHFVAPLHSCRAFLQIEAPADRIALTLMSSMEALDGLPCPDVIDFRVLYQYMCILWPGFDLPPQHFVAPLPLCRAFLQIGSTGRQNRPHFDEFDGSP